LDRIFGRKNFFGQNTGRCSNYSQAGYSYVGGTPAKITALNFITCLLRPGQPLPQRPPYNESDDYKRVPTETIILGSGITASPVATDNRALNAKEVEDIHTGVMNLYFIGTIEYWDMSDTNNLRQTAFCRVLDFPDPQSHGKFRRVDDLDYEYQD
jgi:hypothetical protein